MSLIMGDDASANPKIVLAVGAESSLTSTPPNPFISQLASLESTGKPSKKKLKLEMSKNESIVKVVSVMEKEGALNRAAFLEGIQLIANALSTAEKKEIN